MVYMYALLLWLVICFELPRQVFDERRQFRCLFLGHAILFAVKAIQFDLNAHFTTVSRISNALKNGEQHLH